jgi:hypothetical protein
MGGGEDTGMTVESEISGAGEVEAGLAVDDGDGAWR